MKNQSEVNCDEKKQIRGEKGKNKRTTWNGFVEDNVLYFITSFSSRAFTD